MSLLRLERVTVRCGGQGAHARERIPVWDASLEVEEGEVVAVVGRGRSGRSTLLRVAAGIMRPTEGTVTFEGSALTSEDRIGAPGGIGYCHRGFPRVVGATALQHVATSALVSGLDVAEDDAHRRAMSALARCGVEALASADPQVLDCHEAVCVSIARALVCEPRLLLIDDPAYGVDLSVRDSLLALIHSLARRDGHAVLFSVSSGTELAGVDRAMTIDAGIVRGELRPRGAEIHELPARWRRRRS